MIAEEPNQDKYYEILAEILKKVNRSRAVEPLSASEISQIKLAKNRTNTAVTGLPRSIQLILSIDKNFTPNMRWFDKPLLKHFFDRMDGNKVVQSATISHELQNLFKGVDLKGQTLLWNDTESMPGLIELYSPGDQRVYVYLGEPLNGEFPVARYASEPSVWINELSIIDYILLCSNTDGLFESLEVMEFLKRDNSAILEEVKQKNKEFTDREWWHEKFEFPQ